MEKPVWESYGLFHLDGNGEPQSWIEFNGSQEELLQKLKPGMGVFGVEITVPKPKAGAVQK